MCAPWLLTVGFAAAVAAVLFKLVRLNKVSVLCALSICTRVDILYLLTSFQQSAGMHRVEVKARHFWKPFALYMVTNIVYCSRGLLLHRYGGLELRC
jgi:hypothetical protein